jgi:xanthine/CO dehydrogenase XdhC/CoxF family maturation factor
VYDSTEAQRNVDNEVTKKYGDVGSADGEPLVFFCNDAKEIVSSREPSPRDLFQMKDVTRGPSMHNEQFEGLTWVSVALFDPIRVWLLGASDVACELAKLCRHVGFDVVAVDCDAAYLNEERFPDCERILLEGGTFDGLDGFQNIGKLTYTGRFNNNVIRLILFCHHLQGFFKVTFQGAADAAAVDFTDLNASFFQEAAINTDLTKFIFYEHDLLPRKYIFYQF